MKRSFLIILSIILLTVFTTCALAEKPLTALFDFSEELLFATSNVTITGKAEFTLDGEWFKTAEIKYIQDGDRSFWDLKLTSPKQDGTERHNGYTVIADGSKIYVMEVYRPGIYKTGTGTPQSTLLRKSIQLDLMREMFRMIAEQTEETENSAVLIEENSDKHDLRIRIEENASPKLNLALNLFAQYAARRYFHMDYDQISELHMIPMNAYLTVTEGILASTKSIALKHAEVNIGKDQKGQPEKISGDVFVLLHTAKDGDRNLGISFHAEITDLGKSHVGAFSPAEYNVRLAEGAMQIDNIEYSEVDEYTREKLIEQAKAAWEQAGYTLDPSAYGYSYKQNGRYCTDLNDVRDNLSLSCVTNVAGKILELKNMGNPWQNREFDYEKPCPYPELAEEAAQKVMEYLSQVNPEDSKRIEHLKVQCWMEQRDELYLEFCEDPIAQDWDGFLVVVRVKPDWQLQYYSCFSNG